MPIKIRKTSAGLYEAEVLPSGSAHPVWSSNGAMARSELIEVLKSLGHHQTDIGDAFYEADPNWLD